jgi:hypothetical protein
MRIPFSRPRTSPIIEKEAERFIRALYHGTLHREVDPNGLEHWIRVITSGAASPADVVERFVASEEHRKLTALRLFVPPGHYHSPIVDPIEAEGHLALTRGRPVPDSLAGITVDRRAMVLTWQKLIPFLTTSPFSAEQSRSLRYQFENPSYSWGDGSVLHAMLRLFRPRRLIEIGCGWTSACTLDTVEKYIENCHLTFIEPYPRLLRELIPKCPPNVDVLEQRVQDVPVATFEQLTAGDILFIDSTHVLRTGSDVCFELFEVLPRLASGVLVHFHDMFWPFEYPETWVLEDKRSWNELYAVRAFLTDNETWRIVVFNDYLAKFERPMIESTYPAFLRNSGGALWLQRY